MNWVIGLIVFVVGAFILQGLRKIPADPPHKAVVTRFGERIGKVKDEGWRFFLICPWWYGFILVNVTKVNQDLKGQKVRTPDLAELEVPVSLTWTPDFSKAEHLISYLNSGRESGVKEILADIVRQRLREWAIAATEGPQNWGDAMKAQDEATKILIEGVSGQIVAGEVVTKIRQGNGIQPISHLGIVLNRLNVGEIMPIGELAKKAESQVKEEQERRGEVFEVETDLIKARQLVEAADKAGEKLSLGEAYRIVMEWKATREGRGFTIPGLAPEIARVASQFFSRRR